MKPLVCVALTLLVAVSARARAGEDYSKFSSLPERQKQKIVWDLFDKNRFGMPEHKPICRDLLATQGKYTGANATQFTSAALSLTEQQDWKDLRGLVTAIYRRPSSIWLYERSFHCLRALSGHPVPADLISAAETIRLSGEHESPITDAELARAEQRLLSEPDRETVLVYSLYDAGWHAGKGGTERGRKAAADILKTLDQAKVQARLKNLRSSFTGDLYRPEIDWVIHYLRMTPERSSRARMQVSSLRCSSRP